MKQIINKKLYDTEKSEKICDVEYFPHSIWKTEKGRLFLVNELLMKIINTNQKSIKELLGRSNPEKYIELFGQIEEA